MNYMFGECSSLKMIDISNFSVKKLKDISYMFFNCFSLKKIYYPKIIINDIFIQNIFKGCKQLKNIICKFNK